MDEAAVSSALLPLLFFIQDGEALSEDHAEQFKANLEALLEDGHLQFEGDLEMGSNRFHLQVMEAIRDNFENSADVLHLYSRNLVRIIQHERAQAAKRTELPV